MLWRVVKCGIVGIAVGVIVAGIAAGLDISFWHAYTFAIIGYFWGAWSDPIFKQAREEYGHPHASL